MVHAASLHPCMCTSPHPSVSASLHTLIPAAPCFYSLTSLHCSHIPTSPFPTSPHPIIPTSYIPASLHPHIPASPHPYIPTSLHPHLCIPIPASPHAFLHNNTPTSCLDGEAALDMHMGSPGAALSQPGPTAVTESEANLPHAASSTGKTPGPAAAIPAADLCLRSLGRNPLLNSATEKSMAH